MENYIGRLQETEKKKKLEAKLVIANKELVFQSVEKKRASELNLIEIICQLWGSNRETRKIYVKTYITKIPKYQNTNIYFLSLT